MNKYINLKLRTTYQKWILMFYCFGNVPEADVRLFSISAGKLYTQINGAFTINYSCMALSQ